MFFLIRNSSLFLLWVTPSANRNTYSVAIIVGYLTQGSVLSPATLGYVIATPTELPRVRTMHYKLHLEFHPGSWDDDDVSSGEA